MLEIEAGGLRRIEFVSLRLAGFPHAIFSRHGGGSKPPLQSLNVSSAVGDSPATVASNRRRAQNALQMEDRTLVEVHQVHSSRVVTASQATLSKDPPEADGIISDSPDYLLTMRFADCVPILLADRRSGAVGLGHAGWRGTCDGLAEALVQAMTSAYGCHPRDLLAGLGPAICADHYPVGHEVWEAVIAKQGDWARDSFEERDRVLHLDLSGLNYRQLVRSGVVDIEDCQLCTACAVEDWFSHRGENGRTGRFGVYLAARAA